MPGRHNQGMDVRRLLGSPPARFRLGGDETEVTYELADDLVAVHCAEPDPAAVLTFKGDHISVEPLAAVAPRRLEESLLGPVYRRAPGGALAVPTGRTFVRFAKGESAALHEEDLAAAGYQLEQVPSYAPHAAWVRPASGTVVDALRHLDRLEHLPGVEHAEPQLLTAATRRA
jgi:hypothetical protein